MPRHVKAHNVNMTHRPLHVGLGIVLLLILMPAALAQFGDGGSNNNGIGGGNAFNPCANSPGGYCDDDDGNDGPDLKQKCPDRPVEPDVVGWVFLHFIVLGALMCLSYSLIAAPIWLSRLLYVALHALIWVGMVFHWLRFSELHADLQGPPGAPMHMSGRVTVVLTGVAVLLLKPWHRLCPPCPSYYTKMDRYFLLTCVALVYGITVLALSAVTYEASVVLAQSPDDRYCGPNPGHCGGDYVCFKERIKENSKSDACYKWFCYVQANHDNWEQLRVQLWHSALSQSLLLGGVLSLVVLGIVLMEQPSPGPTPSPAPRVDRPTAEDL